MEERGIFNYSAQGREKGSKFYRIREEWDSIVKNVTQIIKSNITNRILINAIKEEKISITIKAKMRVKNVKKTSKCQNS